MADEYDLVDPGLDRGEIENAAGMMATIEEIAAFLDTTEDVIREFYIKDYERGREKGRLQIRQWQIDQAKNGNVEMLKWLGVKYLGQGDTR